MFDRRSYVHKSSSCEIKAWKKIQASRGIRTHYLYNTGAVL